MFARISSFVLLALVVGVVAHFALVARRRNAGGTRVTERCTWFDRLLVLMLTVGFTILAITSFTGAIAFGGMGGWLLWWHFAGAGIFVVALAVALLRWAASQQFQPDGSSIILWQKILFWTGATLALTSVVAILLSMFPLFGTTGLATLIQVHRYSGLMLVVVAVLYGYIITVHRRSITMKNLNAALTLCLIVLMAGSARLALGEEPTTQPASSDEAPLPLELPKPRFEGTPKNLPPDVNIDKNAFGKKRSAFMAPKGTTNVALHKTVTSSDANPVVGGLDQVTDGDKEGADGSWVELESGPQWVQVDLGADYTIYAIVFWHRHDDIRIYRDVIVQVSDDPRFARDVTTLFNNDKDNTAKQGVGKDYQYIETSEGKLVDGNKTKARYVRVWTNGSTADEQNHFTEIEVYGLPVK